MRLLDSSVFIGILRGNPRCGPTLRDLVQGHLSASVSVATLTELHFGARCGRDPDSQIRRVDRLLAHVEAVLPLDRAIALKAAEIQAGLRPRNQMLDYRDLFIAATALVHQLPLRTLNADHFGRVEALQLDDWD